jgi:hypothetical protein
MSLSRPIIDRGRSSAERHLPFRSGFDARPFSVM